MENLINQINKIDTWDDYNQALAAIIGVKTRLEAAPAIEEAFIAEGLIDKPNTDAKTLDEIPAWVDPKGKRVNGYPHGALVQDDGRVWENAKPGIALDKPSDKSGEWIDVTERFTTTPEPVPFAPETDYIKGDLVEFNEHTYKVLVNHHATAQTTPDKYPALYELIA